MLKTTIPYFSVIIQNEELLEEFDKENEENAEIEITLPCEEDELTEAMESIEVTAQGAHQDYRIKSSIGIQTKRTDDIFEINEELRIIVEILEEHPELKFESIREVRNRSPRASIESIQQRIDEGFLIEKTWYESDETNVGIYFADMFLNQPEELASYIDYGAYGRDILYDYQIIQSTRDELFLIRK